MQSEIAASAMETEDTPFVQDEAIMTMDDVIDNVVSQKTDRHYTWDILQFLKFCYEHQRSYIVADMYAVIGSLLRQEDGEKQRNYRARALFDLKKLLRGAVDTPIVHIDLILPRRYFEFILTLRNKRKGNQYLGKSAYGNRRAALYHLFRAHNLVGYSYEFGIELTNLFKGCFRHLAKNSHLSIATVNNNRNDDGSLVNASTDGSTNNNKAPARCWNSDESKEPISVELYKAILRWLLEYNTPCGVFAYCYMILSWNLMCRSENTALIKFSDLTWSTSFDSFQVYFSHSKTDQLGENSKYARHVYANPKNPLVCPVLALAMYFSCCFNTKSCSGSDFLFPGPTQEKRFGKILETLLQNKVEEVRSMGFEVHQIGTHSIRKGSASYLVSISGGPSTASCLLRGGWSMGNVKDRYLKYSESGDQFVGRCLALNPIMSVDLAASPPHFNVVTGSNDDLWLKMLSDNQFLALRFIPGFGKLTRMCLASLLYHKEWIFRMGFNHSVHVCSIAFHDEVVQKKMEDFPDFIQVTYPWTDDEHSFSGVPPIFAVLSELKIVSNQQNKAAKDLPSQLREGLSEFGINTDRQRFTDLIDTMEKSLKRLTNLENSRTVNEENANLETKDTSTNIQINALAKHKKDTGYSLHYYRGQFNVLPEEWRFPRCGVQYLWILWWLGDKTRSIPPLKSLRNVHVKHLDDVDLDNTETHGRTGKFKSKRKPANKTLCEMKFLMNYIRSKVEEKLTTIPKEINITSVNAMYDQVQYLFSHIDHDLQRKNARSIQLMWTTVARKLRAKLKREREKE